VNRRTLRAVALLVALAVLSGCAASRAYRRGEEFGRQGDWDAAVSYYRRAVEAAPTRPEYRIALERAMQEAARIHLQRARDFEKRDELAGAVLEYRKAVEYDPGNQQAAVRAA
jgi:general secretion pathway protein D